MNDIDPQEARAEALRHLRESDRLFAEWKAAATLPEEEVLYREVSHLRQRGIGYAALESP